MISLKTKIFSILLLISNFAIAQTVINSCITDKNGSPLPYTSIVLLNSQRQGTISSEDGKFSLKIRKENSTDKLVVRAVGFEPDTIPIQQILKNQQKCIQLKEQNVRLDDITITGQKESIWLGAPLRKRGTWVGSVFRPFEQIGIIIRRRQILSDEYLKTIKLRFTRMDLPKQNKLRIRIYAVDSATQQPTKDILYKNIFFSVKKKEVNIDMLPYKLKLPKGDFLVAVEWIEDNKLTIEKTKHPTTKKKELVFKSFGPELQFHTPKENRIDDNSKNQYPPIYMHYDPEYGNLWMTYEEWFYRNYLYKYLYEWSKWSKDIRGTLLSCEEVIHTYFDSKTFNRYIIPCISVEVIK